MLILKRILKYGSVNLVLLPLNILIAWILTHLGMHYLLATAIGFTVQITLAFLINRRWTFEKMSITVTSGLARSMVVEATALMVVIVTTWIGVEYLSLSFVSARIAAVVVAGVWCYILDSLFTFKTHPFRVT